MDQYTGRRPPSAPAVGEVVALKTGPVGGWVVERVYPCVHLVRRDDAGNLQELHVTPAEIDPPPTGEGDRLGSPEYVDDAGRMSSADTDRTGEPDVIVQARPPLEWNPPDAVGTVASTCGEFAVLRSRKGPAHHFGYDYRTCEAGDIGTFAAARDWCEQRHRAGEPRTVPKPQPVATGVDGGSSVADSEILF
ncbi:MAG: hypothetical protein K2P78_14610 [Gemmataceae bacterium]|nr:hypothetical protein [Gemmataceae bacterium]